MISGSSMNEFILALLLGSVQGITEWLPISSSAFVALIYSLVGGPSSIKETLAFTLFLHLGTVCAAILYFRKDIFALLKATTNLRKAKSHTKKTIRFLVIATMISGTMGAIVLFFVDDLDALATLPAKGLLVFVGCLLLFTAALSFLDKRGGRRVEKDLTLTDDIILGGAQGLAVLPGVSRSGMTVSSLLVRNVDETTALRLSFLLSIPLVLVANVVLNLNTLFFSLPALLALLTSFLVGYATIGLLMRATQKFNFGWIALVFGVLMIVSALL